LISINIVLTITRTVRETSRGGKSCHPWRKDPLALFRV
jgi:hypothetical protein